MTSAHTLLRAYAHTIAAVADTCALLGRPGWAPKAERTDGNFGEMLIRAHALVRVAPEACQWRAAALDTFLVVVAANLLDPTGPNKGPALSGYLIAFQPGERAEGPIVRADLAGHSGADIHPHWVPKAGFRSPAAFARRLRNAPFIIAA